MDPAKKSDRGRPSGRVIQRRGLIANFDFTTNSSPVDIEALAARYQDKDFWRRSMTEGDDDGPQE